MNKKINREVLLTSIKSKIDTIPKEHIKAVFDIFLDEFKKQLLETGSFEIINFGRFYIHNVKPKFLKSMVTGEDMVSEPSVTLKFKVFKIYRNLFVKHLDKEKSL